MNGKCIFLTIIPPGTTCLDQSQLARLLDVNENIRTSMEALPHVPPQKPQVLEYYSKDVYPLHYWGAWEKFPLNASSVTPWLDTAEFRKQLTEAGINADSIVNREILNNLENGANIGASGRSCLPTQRKNSKLAYQYGDRLQEAL